MSNVVPIRPDVSANMSYLEQEDDDSGEADTMPDPQDQTSLSMGEQPEQIAHEQTSPGTVQIRDAYIPRFEVQSRQSPPTQMGTRQIGMRGQVRSAYPGLSGDPTVPSSTVMPLALSVAGAAAGGIYAGGWGAGAGLLLTGAAVNAYRYATKQDGEDRTHLAFAAIAAAVGGWMAYKAYTKKTGGSGLKVVE
jgi:hypothetical protein